MDGQTLACGGVAGLENIRHAAALARRVMEKTPHVLLVGEGAQQFALQQGFPLETLHTPESVAEWEKKPSEAEARAERRQAGECRATTPSPCWPWTRRASLGGVCTTSGLAHKLPGRVGDSPLIGAGLYVDDTAGAAGGTGVGEEIIRIGGSLLIVEAMRAGKTSAGGVRVGGAQGQRGGGAPRRASGAGGVSGPRSARAASARPARRRRTSSTRWRVPGTMELLKAKEIGVEGNDEAACGLARCQRIAKPLPHPMQRQAVGATTDASF